VRSSVTEKQLRNLLLLTFNFCSESSGKWNKRMEHYVIFKYETIFLCMDWIKWEVSLKASQKSIERNSLLVFGGMEAVTTFDSGAINKVNSFQKWFKNWNRKFCWLIKSLLKKKFACKSNICYLNFISCCNSAINGVFCFRFFCKVSHIKRQVYLLKKYY
jgi:hypothetical protein